MYCILKVSATGDVAVSLQKVERVPWMCFEAAGYEHSGDSLMTFRAASLPGVTSSCTMQLLCLIH